ISNVRQSDGAGAKVLACANAVRGNAAASGSVAAVAMNERRSMSPPNEKVAVPAVWLAHAANARFYCGIVPVDLSDCLQDDFLVRTDDEGGREYVHAPRC